MIELFPYKKINDKSVCDCCSTAYYREDIFRYKLHFGKTIKFCEKCNEDLFNIMSKHFGIQTIITEHAEMEAAILGDWENNYGMQIWRGEDQEWTVRLGLSEQLEDEYTKYRDIIKGRINNDSDYYNK